MSWTYSGDPSASSKDAVRFLVGDNKPDAEELLVTDEEIEWALLQNSNIYAAASVIADGISTYFSTLADSEEIGPIKVDYKGRVKAYADKAKQLAIKSGTVVSLSVYGGGIDIQDKLAQAEDETLTGPTFSLGMNDFNGTTGGELLS